MSGKKVDIRGLDKATLLAALVSAARSFGNGRLHDDGQPITREQAQTLIDHASQDRGTLYFDWVKGRPIKCDVTGGEIDPALYDRDQGDGAAARVVAQLRADLRATN